MSQGRPRAAPEQARHEELFGEKVAVRVGSPRLGGKWWTKPIKATSLVEGRGADRTCTLYLRHPGASKAYGQLRVTRFNPPQFHWMPEPPLL